MSDHTEDGPEAHPPGEAIDDLPVVSCSRCDAEWDLAFELEELCAGNQAVEQFALDHVRHTGHYPDDVTPWIATCRQCPAREAFLGERPARRWAKTHARHARHEVGIEHGSGVDDIVDRPDPTRG